jgi:hypothetical protein
VPSYAGLADSWGVDQRGHFLGEGQPKFSSDVRRSTRTLMFSERSL